MALPNLNRIRRVNATLPPLQRDHTVPWQQVAGFRHLLISRLHLILPQKLGRASTERERESKEEERERETESEQASKQADHGKQTTAGHSRPEAGQSTRIARPPDQTRPFHTTFIIIPSFSFAFCIPASLPVSVDLWLLLSTADPQSSVLFPLFFSFSLHPKEKELLSYLPRGIDNILLLLCLLAKSSSASSIDVHRTSPPPSAPNNKPPFFFPASFPLPTRDTRCVPIFQFIAPHITSLGSALAHSLAALVWCCAAVDRACWAPVSPNLPLIAQQFGDAPSSSTDSPLSVSDNSDVRGRPAVQLHLGWHQSPHQSPSKLVRTKHCLFAPSHEHRLANPLPLRGRAPSSWSLVSSRSLRACSSYHISTSPPAFVGPLHLTLFDDYKI